MKYFKLSIVILMICNFAQGSNLREYFFFLNFDDSLLYVDGSRTQIIDSRNLIKGEIKKLAKSCLDCTVTIIEKDTFIESNRRWNQKKIVRKKQGIKLFKYFRSRLILNENFKNFSEVLTAVDFRKSLTNDRYLFYFGHSLRYEKKYNEITTSEVLQFLDKITKPQTKLELIVFSSCSNGNLQTLLDFTPYSNFIIAAPSEIHLSMLNVSSFEYGFENYIDQSFEKLRKIDRTEVSISLYDSNKFLNELKIGKTINRLYENRSSYIRYNRYKKPQFGTSYLRFKDLD